MFLLLGRRFRQPFGVRPRKLLDAGDMSETMDTEEWFMVGILVRVALSARGPGGPALAVWSVWRRSANGRQGPEPRQVLVSKLPPLSSRIVLRDPKLPRR